MPGAIAPGSPMSDVTRQGDSFHTNEMVDNILVSRDGFCHAATLIYANGHDLADPLLSPVNGDMHGFPPAILTTGTRDLLLSNTVRVHRKLQEVLGRSLWFAGTRADGVRFVLFADLRATLRVRAGRGQSWGSDGAGALLWAMRPRRWAAARELDEAEATTSEGRRTIVIDADRHPLLFALIRARLGSQSALFFDRDGNGVLDPSDRSAGAIGSGTTDPED